MAAKRQRTEGALEGALNKLETMVKANEPSGSDSPATSLRSGAGTPREGASALRSGLHRIPDAIWAEILLATTTKESKRMRSTAKFLHKIRLIPDKRLMLDSRVWCSRGDVNIPQLLIDERKATLIHLQFEHTADAVQVPTAYDARLLFIRSACRILPTVDG